MSFEHWNRFVESFKADQAARGPQRSCTEAPAGFTAGHGKEAQRRPAGRLHAPNERGEVKTHGKEGKAQDHAHSFNDDDQPGAAAASGTDRADQAGKG